MTRSREANAAADKLEGLVIDLETGARGFVITRQERFLEPWRTARARYVAQAQELIRLADRPEQKQRAREIARDVAAYVTDYSVPLVTAARQNDPSARSIAATAEGKRLVGRRRGWPERSRAATRVADVEAADRGARRSFRARHAAG